MRPASGLGYRTVFVNRHAEPVPPDLAQARVLRDLGSLADVVDELAAVV